MYYLIFLLASASLICGNSVVEQTLYESNQISHTNDFVKNQTADANEIVPEPSLEQLDGNVPIKEEIANLDYISHDQNVTLERDEQNEENNVTLYSETKNESSPSSNTTNDLTLKNKTGEQKPSAVNKNHKPVNLNDDAQIEGKVSDERKVQHNVTLKAELDDVRELNSTLNIQNKNADLNTKNDQADILLNELVIKQNTSKAIDIIVSAKPSSNQEQKSNKINQDKRKHKISHVVSRQELKQVKEDQNDKIKENKTSHESEDNKSNKKEKIHNHKTIASHDKKSSFHPLANAKHKFNKNNHNIKSSLELTNNLNNTVHQNLTSDHNAIFETKLTNSHEKISNTNSTVNIGKVDKMENSNDSQNHNQDEKKSKTSLNKEKISNLKKINSHATNETNFAIEHTEGKTVDIASKDKNNNIEHTKEKTVHIASKRKIPKENKSHKNDTKSPESKVNKVQGKIMKIHKDQQEILETPKNEVVKNEQEENQRKYEYMKVLQENIKDIHDKISKAAKPNTVEAPTLKTEEREEIVAKPRKKYSTAIIAVSLSLIVSTVLLTIIGIYYRKLSLDRQRYFGHVLLDTEEDLSLFNRSTYQDDEVRYESWNRMSQ